MILIRFSETDRLNSLFLFWRVLAPHASANPQSPFPSRSVPASFNPILLSRADLPSSLSSNLLSPSPNPCRDELAGQQTWSCSESDSEGLTFKKIRPKKVQEVRQKKYMSSAPWHPWYSGSFEFGTCCLWYPVESFSTSLVYSERILKLRFKVCFFRVFSSPNARLVFGREC